MSNVNDDLFNEIKEISTKQREIAEKYGKDSLEMREHLEKSEKKWDDFEKLNTEVNEKMAQSEKTEVELKERITHLETLGAIGVANGGLNGEQLKSDSKDVMNALLKGSAAYSEFMSNPDSEKKAARVMGMLSKSVEYADDQNDYKKFALFLKSYGQKAETGLLRSDIGELGGYLCPDEWSNELNKNIIEYSPLRSFARVKTTRAKTYKEPIRIGIPAATWPGEARQDNKTNPNYSMNNFDPVRLQNTCGVTLEELHFNSYDLVSNLMQDNAEAFAVAEGQAFFDGSGIERPTGWTIDPDVPEYTSAASGVVDFDDMIGITGELKRGYNPIFMFNRRTLALLRLLQDGSGRYIWNPAFGDAAGGAPATINGFRYSSDFIEFDDLDAGAGKFPILLADMLRFYQIVDRMDMSIIRDEYTQKREGIVEFTWNKFTTGKPKIKEAGIRMKVKA